MHVERFSHAVDSGRFMSCFLQVHGGKHVMCYFSFEYKLRFCCDAIRPLRICSPVRAQASNSTACEIPMDYRHNHELNLSFFFFFYDWKLNPCQSKRTPIEASSVASDTVCKLKLCSYGSFTTCDTVVFFQLLLCIRMVTQDYYLNRDVWFGGSSVSISVSLNPWQCIYS